jgi:N utilization substance protein B
VINETLEIAKRYAAPESLQFLNGVLDAIGRELLEERLKK